MATDRKAALAATIDADLSATPLSREKLDLLWLGAEYLSLLQSFGGQTPAFLGDESETTEMLQRCARALRDGKISNIDVAWALRVDEMAGEAERRFHAEDVTGAIDTFRKALALAPGCDNYMMSMAICYYQLGMPNEALRYLERAHEINPESERILRKLNELREDLGATDDEEPSEDIDDGWDSFEHSSGLFSIRYPSHWQSVAQRTEGSALTFVDGTLRVEVFGQTRPPISREDDRSALFQVVRDGMPRQVLRAPGVIGGHLIARDQFSLGGADCAVFLFQYELQSRQPLKSYCFLTGSTNEVIYLVLTAPAQDFDLHVPDFEGVIESLRTPWKAEATPPRIWNTELGVMFSDTEPRITRQPEAEPLTQPMDPPQEASAGTPVGVAVLVIALLGALMLYVLG